MKENVVKVIVGVICFIVCFCIGSSIGANLFGNKIEEKTYSNSGFTITMEDGFYEKDYIGATFYYESQNAGISVVKETFEDLSSLEIDENVSLEEYAELVSYVNETDNEYQKLNDQILYYTYDNTASGKNYSYMTAVTKGNTAFWIINLFCEEDNKDTYFPKFEKWLATIEVE